MVLVDNRTSAEIPASTQSEDWSILKNQIFLGLLGSSISPRRHIAQIVKDSDNAGVRFVYFSTRNMRRTKEIASAMGIDVAWNCAISLEPLGDNEDDDEVRRQNFGEEDINAKLPHGVEAVVRHLKDVDNVPLLVRLYTDVTKQSTTEMIKIFRDNSDTVLSIGLSHNSQNREIFAASSISMGIDLLLDDSATQFDTGNHNPHQFTKRLCPEEISIVSSIASSSCFLNMPLGNGLTDLPYIINEGRTSLNAVKSAFGFTLVAYISFASLMLFNTFSISQSLPYLPGDGSMLSLLLVIPTLAIAMAFSGPDGNSLSVVPMKNINSENFGRGERKRLFFFVLLKAIFPAVASQIVYLISFGSTLIEMDMEYIANQCGLMSYHWKDVVRCTAIDTYTGSATVASGVLVIAFHTLCMIVMSSSFLQGSIPIIATPTPLKKNKIWVLAVVLCILYLFLYTSLKLESGAAGAMPWYFYILGLVSPIFCLIICENIKRRERKHEQRAAKMRRLHFETRLGMWSPKANQ